MDDSQWIRVTNPREWKPIGSDRLDRLKVKTVLSFIRPIFFNPFHSNSILFSFNLAFFSTEPTIDSYLAFTLVCCIRWGCRCILGIFHPALPRGVQKPGRDFSLSLGARQRKHTPASFTDRSILSIVSYKRVYAQYAERYGAFRVKRTARIRNTVDYR